MDENIEMLGITIRTFNCRLQLIKLKPKRSNLFTARQFLFQLNFISLLTNNSY